MDKLSEYTCKRSDESCLHKKEEPKVFTPEEVDKIREVFMLFDKDGDDTISNNELGIVMRALGQCPTEAEMKDIMAEIDADGSGIIEFEPFVELMARCPKGQIGSLEELQESFKEAFDHGSNGQLKVKEFRKLMTSIGEPLTDEQMDEMLDQFKPDEDGMLCYSEFAEMMMKE